MASNSVLYYVGCLEPLVLSEPSPIFQFVWRRWSGDNEHRVAHLTLEV